jgi:hypothetical protein
VQRIFGLSRDCLQLRNKRSPDERSDIQGFVFALTPNIAALMPTTC